MAARALPDLGALVVARLRANVPDADRGLDLVNGAYRQIAEQLKATDPGERASVLTAFLNGAENGTTMLGAIAQADPNDDPLGDLASRPGARPLTDLGNAERLVDRFGAALRYCAPLGGWFIWTGRMWQRDETGQVLGYAKQVARGIYREAAACEDRTERDELAAHAKRSEAAARLEALLFLAQSALPVETGQLDQHPWLLNVENGTIDLRTAELREHDPDDLITRLIPLPYDPESACPRWQQFLTEILPDQVVRDFIHRAAGYSAVGNARERVVLFPYGSGRNGKGILMQVLHDVLGAYALRVPSETFLAKRYEGVPNDIAKLRGVRFAFSSETGQGRSLDEAKLKDLTGGEAIPARFMRAEWFTFLPEFTPWIATNYKPTIKGTDHAIWDRVRLVPFTVRFRLPEEQSDGQESLPLADNQLAEKLKAEHAGILAWIVEGARAWCQDGLGLPAPIAQAVAEYRSDMDVFGAFLEDRCVHDPAATTSASAVFLAYQNWCIATGEDGRKPALAGAATGGVRLHTSAHRQCA